MTLQELYDGLIGDLGQGTVDAEGRERIWEALKAAEALGADNAPAYCAPAGTFDRLGRGAVGHTCPWTSRDFHADCEGCVADRHADRPAGETPAPIRCSKCGLIGEEHAIFCPTR